MAEAIPSTLAVQLGHVSSDGQVEVVPGFVQERSEVASEINAPTQHLHIFSTAASSYIDGLLKRACLTSSPTVQIRIGVVSSTSVQWSPWQNHLLVSFTAERKGQGYVVALKTTDGLGQMMRVPKTRSHQGTIGSIVESIVAENGLKSLVEPTAGQRSYIQSNATDGHFILDKLRSRSANASGHANYGVWVADNVLHFHTLTYASSVVDLAALNLPGSQLIIGSQVQDRIDDGAPGLNFSSVDLNAGRITVESSDPSLAVKLENETVDFSAIPRIWSSQHVSLNQADELRALAQTQFEQARLGMFSATLNFSSGYNVIQLGDIIRTSISAAESSRSSWSGLYLVRRIKYAVVRGALTTNVLLYRGEFSNLAPRAENASTGRPVDLSAAQKTSSRVSKTTGSISSGGQIIREVVPA